MRNVYLPTLLLLSWAMIGLTGCNELAAGSGADGSLESGLDQPSQPGEPEVDVDMEALDKDLDEVESSLISVESEIKKINIGYIGGSTSSLQQKSVIAKLGEMLDKLVATASQAFAKVDALRAKIDAQVAKLDPSNPLHAIALIKLREAQAYLDNLEEQLHERFVQLVSNVGKVVANVDEQVAKMDPKNPLTFVVAILWGQVRGVLLDFERKLLDI